MSDPFTSTDAQKFLTEIGDLWENDTCDATTLAKARGATLQPEGKHDGDAAFHATFPDGSEISLTFRAVDF